MAFTNKALSFSFALANGSFGSSGGNSATLSGLRASCKITNAGPPSMGALSADIYGLPLSMMNQLTMLGTQQNLVGQNTIIVQAGDAGGTMATVFQGNIDFAFVNAQSQPDVSFHIEAHAMSYLAVKPVVSTSVQGSGDVAQMMQTLAGQMGLTFQNNGVSTKLANPYLSGSGWTQALTLAQHSGIAMDVSNGTLTIAPPGQMSQDSAIMVSPQTGMRGYPAYNQAGIIVTTLFDPTQNLKRLSTITVQSDLTPVCGNWNVVGLDYELESMVPRGEWFAIATCVRVGSSGPSGAGQ